MVLQQVFCRVIALTPKLFFSKKSWYNIVDFIIVIFAFAASIATACMVEGIAKEYRMVRNWRIILFEFVNHIAPPTHFEQSAKNIFMLCVHNPQSDTKRYNLQNISDYLQLRWCETTIVNNYEVQNSPNNNSFTV